jgi:hypothetical protein
MTTETTETVNKYHKAAVDYVNSHSMADIIDHIEGLEKSYEERMEANRVARGRLQEMVDIVTKFIKANYEDGADTDEIKKLADELDIELTKTLTVTFRIDCEFDLVVPLDYDEDNINDGHFNIVVEPNFRDDDIEVDSESVQVEDFDVSE